MVIRQRAVASGRPPSLAPSGDASVDGVKGHPTSAAAPSATKVRRQEQGNISLANMLPAIAVTSLVSVGSYFSCASAELAEDVVVATVRTFLQLSLLAAMLSPLFRFVESQATYNEATIHHIWCCSPFAVSLLGAVAIFIVMPVPWYSPRVIPLFGMLFNNALSGVSLALDVLFTELQSKQRETIELMISFGADAWSATRPSFQTVLAASLKPLLDEATSALDTTTKLAVEESIQQIAETNCVVMVTHDEEQIERLGAIVMSLSAAV